MDTEPLLFTAGWSIAMRRIDEAFDIPQYVASSLVRKIAANSFHLPAIERKKFRPLPDSVIESIERIVRGAYLEASESVGGDNQSEYFWQQAQASRRDMVANGDLLTHDAFRARIGATKEQLTELLVDASIFAIEVDGVPFIPAVLAEPSHRRRLHEICRNIQAAPPSSRLDFLTATRSSLGDVSPCEMLSDDRLYKRMRKAATAWAAEYSRTAVKIYSGKHSTEPNSVEPLYIAIAEADARLPLWKRALEALCAPGYQQPLGPYGEVRTFSLFISRLTAGQPGSTFESRVQVNDDGKFLQFVVVDVDGSKLWSQEIASNGAGLIETAKQVIAHLSK